MVHHTRTNVYNDFYCIFNVEGSVALVFVWLLYAYTYYAFIYLILIPIFYKYYYFSRFIFIFFHFLFGLTIWSWIKAMTTNPGTSCLEDLTEHGFKLCKKCNYPKPPRAHHCSLCNRCILRMDHHCPFVNNCIGWRNHKYFLLYLFYHEIHTFFALLWTFVILLLNPPNLTVENIFWIAQVFVGTVLALGFFTMVMILLSMQLYMLYYNMTTIEFSEKWDVDKDESENPYYIDPLSNFKTIFGDKWYLWIIPIETNQNKGGGILFMSKDE